MLVCIVFPRRKKKQTNKQKKTAYILEGVESENVGASEVGMSP